MRVDLPLIRRSFASVYRRFTHRDQTVSLIGGTLAIGCGGVSSMRLLVTVLRPPVPSIRGPLPQIQEPLARVGVLVSQVGRGRPHLQVDVSLVGPHVPEVRLCHAATVRPRSSSSALRLQDPVEVGEVLHVRPAHRGGLPLPALDLHRDGWEHYLSRLAIRAAGGDPGPDPFAEN